MKKRQGDKKKQWHKPAYESLKFSQTLNGRKPNVTESVTTGQQYGRGFS